jgi:DNA-binding transcriptional LysR family regulator
MAPLLKSTQSPDRQKGDWTPMDVQQLKVFVEVARRGSFAAAARHLDLAPSAVTRAVAAVEAQLGARLLQRTTRQVSLTEAGAEFLHRVEHVLQELDVAVDAVRAHSGELRGSVRITASVGYGQSVLVPLLPALHKRHPGLTLDLMLTDAVVDLVAQQVDLALRLGPSTDSSMIGIRLRPVRYRVVASPAYLRRHGRPRTPADLVNCACLRFPLPGFRTAWTFRELPSDKAAPGEAASARAPSIETVHVRGWMMASTSLALHRASLDGLGPALLADWLVDADVEAGRLVNLFPRHEASATDFDSAVWLLYASRSHLPARVRGVVDFLKEALA